MNSPLHVLVTGATGYVGEVFCRLAVEEGVRLTILGRHRPAGLAPEVYTHVPYALGDSPPAEAFAGVDAVVHLAAASIGDPRDGDLDLRAAEDLLAASRACDVATFLFVSSQSARPDAATAYGRSKAAIESLLERSGECAVRAGLVYGGPERGLYGTLCSLVRVSPLLPVLAAEAPVQPVQVTELGRLLLALARRGADVPRRLCIGAPRPIPFKTFLAGLARAKSGRQPLLVPVPQTLARLAAVAAGWLPGLAGRRDNILGLYALRPMDSAADLQNLGLVLAPFDQALEQETARLARPADPGDALDREGRTLMRYLLGRRADDGLARRYAAALRALGQADSLALPAAAHRRPWQLRLHEPPGAAGALEFRLHVATSLAEASPQGAQRFLPTAPRGRLRGFAALGLLVAVEGLLLPLRWLLGIGDRR